MPSKWQLVRYGGHRLCQESLSKGCNVGLIWVSSERLIAIRCDELNLRLAGEQPAIVASEAAGDLTLLGGVGGP